MARGFEGGRITIAGKVVANGEQAFFELIGGLIVFAGIDTHFTLDIQVLARLFDRALIHTFRNHRVLPPFNDKAVFPERDFGYRPA